MLLVLEVSRWTYLYDLHPSQESNVRTVSENEPCDRVAFSDEPTSLALLFLSRCRKLTWHILSSVLLRLLPRPRVPSRQMTLRRPVREDKGDGLVALLLLVRVVFERKTVKDLVRVLV
jgi:hypothetical protein